jgi:hypothetical protein
MKWYSQNPKKSRESRVKNPKKFNTNEVHQTQKQL